MMLRELTRPGLRIIQKVNGPSCEICKESGNQRRSNKVFHKVPQSPHLFCKILGRNRLQRKLLLFAVFFHFFQLWMRSVAMFFGFISASTATPTATSTPAATATAAATLFFFAALPYERVGFGFTSTSTVASASLAVLLSGI